MKNCRREYEEYVKAINNLSRSCEQEWIIETPKRRLAEIPFQAALIQGLSAAEAGDRHVIE